MQRSFSLAAPLAALLAAAALAGFGAAFPVYSHLQHPVAMLGASGVPRAAAFNALVFVVPGVLAMLSAWQLRSRLADLGWLARIGAQALLLSAVAFAVQGLLPLDSTDLEAPASRLHAAAWTAWWLAFATGALMLWLGRAGSRVGSRVGAAAVLACAMAALVLAVLAPVLLPAGLCQRLAFAAWFCALWLAGRAQP